MGLLQSGRLVRGEPPGTAWLLSRDFGEECVCVGGGGGSVEVWEVCQYPKTTCFVTHSD